MKTNTYPAFKKAVEAAFKSPASDPGVCYHPEDGWFTESLIHPNQGCVLRLLAYDDLNTGKRSVGDGRKAWREICEIYDVLTEEALVNE